MGSAGRMLDTMRVAILFFALLAAFAVGDDPCDSTAPPEPAPAPSPAPTPAPSPAPTPGCADKPGDWKSSMVAPMMVETVQMVPTATPMMVETAVPMMQTG